MEMVCLIPYAKSQYTSDDCHIKYTTLKCGITSACLSIKCDKYSMTQKQLTNHLSSDKIGSKY